MGDMHALPDMATHCWGKLARLIVTITISRQPDRETMNRLLQSGK